MLGVRWFQPAAIRRALPLKFSGNLDATLVWIRSVKSKAGPALGTRILP